ncbi:DUF1800 domain-containing protein [Pseudooceanicola sp. C21-150M6]|uniref:DUF1800 domain-containing protein n=1 Tax=Pseudooceanicola sp. C21-150M6 TaxID=3434355 RepID=UPI003D7FF6AC
MPFDPIIAEVRFGCGLSPGQAPAGSVSDMLARLEGPDAAAEAWPVEAFAQFQERTAQAFELRRMRAKNRGTAIAKDAVKQWRQVKKAARLGQDRWMAQSLMRRASTADGFRERLAGFWADHFTAIGKAGVLKFGAAPYVETSVRPYMTGHFAAMLRACVTAPLMIHYLDQERSMGPGSIRAIKRGGKAGLNENLAREVLELHTLGVGAAYSQADVREFAELLAGVSYRPDQGFRFRADYAEPGAETVLGVSYGGPGKARLEDVFAALDDLSVHPATARHISSKLAVHFVGDRPSEALIAQMTATYQATDGLLSEVYRTMLEHPDAWAMPGNVKPPIDFVGSALRALAVPALPVRQVRELRLMLRQPMALMGQDWERPDGPDGWPEEDGDWITPQRLAARLQWALNVPPVLADPLPDPRDFVTAALGREPPEALRFAARAAETRAEGIALILASPSFQRT